MSFEPIHAAALVLVAILNGWLGYRWGYNRGFDDADAECRNLCPDRFDAARKGDEV